nr:protein kinase superfamily protein [Tanacetum cinerariifolium]
MEASDIESVLEFFRQNHLSFSESALLHDLFLKSSSSSSSSNFLVPPPLPPIKIPPTRHPLKQAEVVETSDDDDQDFVSLGSSTTDLCSSEFTNPYGIRTVKGASSHASSDRLSQFGTARDYHEFDMQNDLNWDSKRTHVLQNTNSEYDAAKVDEVDAIVTSDEYLFNATEDEYEEFDLKIVHRKNSKVVQARDLQTGVDVCLKIIKNEKDFFDQSLDEIKLLKLVNKHDPADERHILRLYDYFYFH